MNSLKDTLTKHSSKKELSYIAWVLTISQTWILSIRNEWQGNRKVITEFAGWHIGDFGLIDRKVYDSTADPGYKMIRPDKSKSNRGKPVDYPYIYDFLANRNKHANIVIWNAALAQLLLDQA